MKKVDALVASKELTELEGKIINWMLAEGLSDEQGFSDLESGDIAGGIGVDSKVVRGAIGSLVKKDYLFTEQVNGEGNPIVYVLDYVYDLDDNPGRRC